MLVAENHSSDVMGAASLFDETGLGGSESGEMTKNAESYATARRLERW